MNLIKMKNGIQRRIRKYGCKVYAATFAKIVRIRHGKVYVDNFIGKGYGGNPKYIVDEILKKKPDWEIVWAVNDLNTPMPDGVRKVKYGTLACAWEQASAEFWIDNVRNAHLVKKRKGQIYLHTSHGAFGFKGVEKFVENKLSHEYVEAAKYDGSITDAIIAENRFKVEQYKKYYWLSDNTEILKTGMLEPGYSLSDEELQNRKSILREKYGMTQKDFVILYAPTFRNEDVADVYNINFKRVLDCLEKKTGRGCKIIVRFHPNVNLEKVNDVIDQNDIRIMDGNNFPDEMERYILSDMLITDYSSVMYYFSLLNKPVFIFAKDYEAYKKERTLLLRPEDTPYSFAQNIEEFEQCVIEYDQKKYQEKVCKFYENFEIYREKDPVGKAVNWMIMHADKENSNEKRNLG